MAQAGMEPSKLPADVTKQLRTLAHDLSNAIETIMQASYLLSQAKLDDTNKRWVEMIEAASRQAVKVNREIREVLRAQGGQNTGS